MKKIYEILYDGWELTNDGYYREAKKKFKEVLKMDPEFVDAYNGLGSIAIEGYKWKTAGKYYRKAYDLTVEHFGGKLPREIIWGELHNRQYLRSMHGLGLVLWGLGKTEEALQIFKKMLRLNPMDNQGIRFIIPEIEKGKSCEEYIEEAKEDGTWY